MATRAITFNPKNIDGSMYVDSTIQVQSDTLNGSINSVNTNLNNSLTVPTITYVPSAVPLPQNVYTITTPGAFPYATCYGYYYDVGLTNLIYILSISDSTPSTSLVCDATFANYQSYSGYADGTSNHVYTLTDSYHLVYCIQVTPSYYASFLNNTNYIYGVNFNYFVFSATNYNGLKLYFPTSNVPRWMFIVISNDYGSTWSAPIVPKQYLGNGNEVFTWMFNSDFTAKATGYRLIFANASSDTIDFGGVQWIINPSGVGLGNSTYPCNIVGKSLLFNNNPFPFLNNYPISSDDSTVITTSLTSTIRWALTCRITANKYPVFSVANAPSSSQLVLDILQNGTSIYGGSGAGHLPTIDVGSNNTGSTYSTVSSSCGLFYGTNSDGSRTFTEGDTIKFIVSSFGGTIATGLKVTIYNS